MIQPSVVDSTIIAECLKAFPKAVSDVEAVDLAAQSVFKEIRDGFGITTAETQMRISRYNYLKDLRAYLYNKRISDMCGFSVGRN
jgi:hypothetical protein